MAFLAAPELRTNYQLMLPEGAARAATPIALIHGLGANLAFWYLGAAPHLAGQRPLLMHDLRGHGQSSMPSAGYRLETLAEDFRVLLDALAIERAHVVGHSHGARVAMAFALANPARVASLTVADTQLRALQPPMRLGEWPHWARWKAELAGQGVTSFPPDEAEIDFRVLAELGPRGGLGRMERAVVEAASPAPRPLARLAARAEGGGGISLRSRQMGARGGRQWQALLQTTSAGTELHDESALDVPSLDRLTMPTLLMYGAVSHCVPTSERLLERLPDARRILVPEAGHFFPLVKPRLFARALRTFVAGVEARPERAPQARRALVLERLRSARLRRGA